MKNSNRSNVIISSPKFSFIYIRTKQFDLRKIYQRASAGSGIIHFCLIHLAYLYHLVMNGKNQRKILTLSWNSEKQYYRNQFRQSDLVIQSSGTGWLREYQIRMPPSELRRVRYFIQRPIYENLRGGSWMQKMLYFTIFLHFILVLSSFISI